MGEWKECKLGDVAGVLNGYAFKSEEFSTTGIPVIKIKNVASGSLRMDDVQYYPYEMTERIRKFQIKKKDILIAMTGSHITQPSSMVGRSCRYDRDDIALLNQRVGKLFSKDENRLNEDFLFYFIKHDEIPNELALSAGGSANQANISSEQIRNLNIYLPPLPEQKSIASILSSLDDKIDLMHRQNKTLEVLAETLFRQWFVEEAEEGWEMGKIGDVISVRGGTTPSTKETEYWDGDVHWTTPRDLSSHTAIFLTTTERKITAKGLAQIGSGLLPIGTVLLSSRAPIGYLAITEISVAINQGYVAIVCDKTISNYFIFLWIKKNLDTIINAANGSTFLEISKSTFKDLDFQIPPRTKLDDFDRKAAPLFGKIKSNIYQMRTLTRLRDTLLPKLMSGEVRVKDVEKKEIIQGYRNRS